MTGESSFHPASFRDPAGRVFLEGDSVLRQLRPDWGDFFVQLTEDGRLARLIDQAPLIPTELNEFAEAVPPFGQMSVVRVFGTEGGLIAVLQTPLIDCVSFCPFAFE